MTQQKQLEDCYNWIAEQQKLLDQFEFESNNKKLLYEAVTYLKKQAHTVDSYRSTVERLTKTLSQDDKEKERIESAYSQLLSSSQQRLRCAESSSQILALDDLFGPLVQSFTSTAACLVQDLNRQSGGSTQNQPSGSASISQDCILANRDAWDHVARQLRCVEVHLKNAAEYQKFFFDAKEFQRWISSDIRKAAEILKPVGQESERIQPDDIEALLSRIKTALTIVLHWKSKLESMTDRSRRVIPVSLRLQRLSHERPALSLTDYRTSSDGLMKIREGEEVTLIDNSDKLLWKVRNSRGEVCQVPSNQLVIEGPDPTATEIISKLRLQFLSDWTNLIKDGGRSLLKFLSRIFKHWSPEEEQMLRTLSPAKKQKILQLLKDIFKIFSPAWDQLPAFQRLRPKMERMKTILDERGIQLLPTNDASILFQNVLLLKTESVSDAVSTFEDWWINWEQFKILTESLLHPEYLLAVSSSDQLKFISPEDLKKKWQRSLLDFDETDFKEAEDLMANESSAKEEFCTTETAKEMAETSQLTTSEQEEKQTFVITGVTDPRNMEQISLDRAVVLGIINQREGKYVNPATGETMPIPTAMTAGRITVEFTRTNKSAEKRSDLALITIKSFRESRPFTVRTVVDAKTDRRMTADEAIRAGILDEKKGLYVNTSSTSEPLKMSLADALDCGLLAVDFDDCCSGDSAADRECILKTYAIHAVIDAKTMARKTFSEAVTLGLIDPQTGSYCNRSTGEQVSVGDAIRRGLVKATVVHDSSDHAAALLDAAAAVGLTPAAARRCQTLPDTAFQQNGMSNGHNK